MKIKMKRKVTKKKKVQKPKRTAPIPIVVETVVTPPVVTERVRPPRKVRTWKMPDKHRGNVRWAFDEAIRLVKCDRCDAMKGEPCLGKRERAIGTIHITRLQAYRREISAEEYQLRHSGATHVGVGQNSGGEL